ncbi:hypothetical protein C8R44DRAFT_727263 [Mycena epipterygia]|nr:hypothetical protein C8R44DRAFT_727263 [Mycena epipterygia]
MTCDLPFFPNAGNYVADDEHDNNPRKYWFLVLGVGLFTKKTDADAHCKPDSLIILYTKEHARRRWEAFCRRRHTHDLADTVSSGEEGSLPSARASRSCARRPPPAQSVRPAPPAKTPPRAKTPPHAKHRSPNVPKKEPPHSAKREATPAMKREGAASVISKHEPSASFKREPSAATDAGNGRAPVSAKREARSSRKLPLYVDTDDDFEDDFEDDIDDALAPRADVPLPQYLDDSPPNDGPLSHKRSLCAVTSTPTASTKRARGRPASSAAARSPSPVPLSPSVSSPSSVSASSRTSTARSSVSVVAPRTPRVPVVPATAHLAPPMMTPLPRAGLGHFATAPSSASASAVGASSASASTSSASTSRSGAPRLLFNSTKGTIYKDVEIAVQEMGLKDVMQVVECADVVGYCAGQSGKMAR